MAGTTSNPPGGPTISAEKKSAIAPSESKEIASGSKGDKYDRQALYSAIRKCADARLSGYSGRIFKMAQGGAGIKADTVESLFLAGIEDPSIRATWRCNACRDFLRSCGDLVIITPDNRILPLFWNASAAEDYRGFAKSSGMIAAVLTSKDVAIGSVFAPPLSKNTEEIKQLVLGTPESSGGYRHMWYGFPLANLISSNGISNHDYPMLTTMLRRVLTDHSLPHVSGILELFEKKQLAAWHEHLPMIRWLHEAAKEWQTLPSSDALTSTFLWRKVTQSFVGCINSARSGALSTVLECKSKSLEEIQAAWATVISPSTYMRPSAPPSAGNVRAAENLLGMLGVKQADLARYFVKYNDPQLIAYSARALLFFDPTLPATAPLVAHISGTDAKTPDLKVEPTKPTVAGGIFADIVTKETKKSSAPIQMSWTTFLATVVPTAKSMEFNVPATMAPMVLVTGAKGTFPLMQWHKPDHLVSWYTYPEPRDCRRCNLSEGKWIKVTALIRSPHLWGDDARLHERHGSQVLMGLEGATDLECTTSCLFPSFLKSDFHGVRSTIEAHNRQTRVIDPDSASPNVCGIGIYPDTSGALIGGPHRIRVLPKSGSLVLIYEIRTHE